MVTDQAIDLPDTLTMSEVPGIHRSSRGDFRAGRFPQQIDLGSVERADSSALAMLIDWQAQARVHGRVIEFINPPQTLLVLARLSQADQLLGWDADLSENEQ